MASRTGETEMDPLRTGGLDDPHLQRARSSGPSPGKREPDLGLSADPGASWPRWEFGSPLRACGQSFAGMANPILVDSGPTWAEFSASAGGDNAGLRILHRRTCRSDAFTRCSSSRSNTRRIYFAGVTANRAREWVVQQARRPHLRILRSAPEQPSPRSGTEIRIDSNFSTRCPAPRASESSETSVRSPRANAFAGSHSGTVVEERTIGSSSSGALI